MEVTLSMAIFAMNKAAILGVYFVALYFFYLLLLAIYNITLHPLAIYDGPKLWAMTPLTQVYYSLKGTLVYQRASLHDKYGPVVRMGPNELSFNLIEAWSNIYGVKAALPKSNSSINGKTASGGVPGMFLAFSSEDHARMRKNLNPAFSEKALREQEQRIMEYVNLLIRRLAEHSERGPVNIGEWYNYTTFDIIGELLYGDSFDCLENSMLNDWIQAVLPGLKANLMLRQSENFPPLDKILKSMIPKSLRDKREKHQNYTIEKLNRRLARKDGPPDFLTPVQPLLNTPKGFSSGELETTASTFIVAGSETSATTLTACTYLLLTHPSSLHRLISLIRTTFPSSSGREGVASGAEAITIQSTAQPSLKYLTACIDESLRLFPPAATSSPRLTGPQGAVVAGHWVPPGTAVAVPQWAAFRSRENFTDPEMFVPERWLGDERFGGDRVGMFHPFSYGPRNCIGITLAYAEIRVILAKVLWHFDLELCDESKDWLNGKRNFVLWEKEPLMVKLVPVQREAKKEAH